MDPSCAPIPRGAGQGQEKEVFTLLGSDAWELLGDRRCAGRLQSD